MLAGDQVTIAILKDEKFILQMKLERAMLALKEISKEKVEAGLHKIPTYEAQVATIAIGDIDEIGKFTARPNL